MRILYDDGLNYDNMTDEEYLEHHGVKGMRWGVRRFKKYRLNSALKKYNRAGESLNKAKASAEKSGIKATFKKKTTSGEASKVDSKGKPIDYKDNPKLNGDRRMSNAELKARVTRLELEKRYLDALPKVPPTKSKIESVLDTTTKYIGYAEKAYNSYKTVDKILREISAKTGGSQARPAR